jgi:ubiquitin-protein ligase
MFNIRIVKRSNLVNMFRNSVLLAYMYFRTQEIIKVIYFYLVWNGHIIINDGLYKDGKFSFNILMPKEYPAKIPEVVFNSEIYHPLINPTTGSLDVEVIIYDLEKVQ